MLSMSDVSPSKVIENTQTLGEMNNLRDKNTLFLLSPNGKRLVCLNTSGMWGMLKESLGLMSKEELTGLGIQVDGQAFAPPHGYRADSIVFSPDSHLAYIACEEGGERVVVDGVPSSSAY
jgi:hypothetical protein